MFSGVRSRLTVANVTSVAALVFVMGGGAYALSGIPGSSGVFHGCVNNRTGALRVVKSAKSCRHRRVIRRAGKRVVIPGELAIAWSQTGPRGPQGTPGLQGRPGTNGTSGVNGTNGAPGLPGPGAVKLIYNAAAGTGRATIGTAGPFTLKADCLDLAPGTAANFYVNGPAGNANWSQITSFDDGPNPNVLTNGTGLTAGVDTAITGTTSGSQTGHFGRQAATIMLSSGGTLVQVEYNMVADSRTTGGHSPSCFLYGTAILAS